MIAVFNRDMAGRLRDLHEALAAGQAIEARFEPAYGKDEGMGHRHPPRVLVSIPEADRRFVLTLEMAPAVAEQLDANGFAEFAQRVRCAAGPT